MLAAGAVAIDVAGIGLLHMGVVYAGILDGLFDGFGGHDSVGLTLARLGKLNHADACYACCAHFYYSYLVCVIFLMCCS